MTRVMTALGPIDAESLGHVLVHEHVFINQMREYRGTGLLNDSTVMADELVAFRRSGGGTVVDVTTGELTVGAAPDPLGLFVENAQDALPDQELVTRHPSNVAALQRLSAETGVHLVLGTGHYRDPYLGSALDRFDVAAVAESMIRDIRSGFPGTTARAGVIGEVGADKWYLSGREERVLRAAGRAAQATGVPVTTHAARWPVGTLQLDAVTGEGVDPRRVAIGHCDTVAIPEYHEELARRGAYVQFDTIREVDSGRALADRVSYVTNLVRKGYLSSVLLSHDVCLTDHLSSKGGTGFLAVRERFAPMLRDAGLDEGEVLEILVENPKRFLGAGAA